jgi:hypothetical protein
VADLLSAASLLLAVVSVVYGLWYPDLVTTLATSVPKHAEDRKQPHRKVSSILFRRSLPLAVAAILVGSIFLPDAIILIVQALHQYHQHGLKALGSYDAVATAFCLVELFSIALAWHATRLCVKLNRLRQQLSAA